jgi:uncharacterized membrane protein YhaH (DUF805 family)
MSKPVFEDLFNFSGRRNRQSYIMLLLTVIFGGGIGLAALFTIGTALTVSSGFLGGVFLLAGFALAVAMAVVSWSAGSQRVRDFNQSGVWILLCLIPYVGFVVSLAIMFVPSTDGENKYGPSCI